MVRPTLGFISGKQKRAAFFGTYIEYSSRKEVDRPTHVIAAKVNFLGQQDAARKQQRCLKDPRAWSGAMMSSKNDEGLFTKWLMDECGSIIRN